MRQYQLATGSRSKVCERCIELGAGLRAWCPQLELGAHHGNPKIPCVRTTSPGANPHAKRNRKKREEGYLPRQLETVGYPCSKTILDPPTLTNQYDDDVRKKIRQNARIGQQEANDWNGWGCCAVQKMTRSDQPAKQCMMSMCVNHGNFRVLKSEAQ